MERKSYRSPDLALGIQNVISKYEDYSDFPLHNHMSYEIFRLHSESAVFRVEGRAYDLFAGDIMLFNSHEFHHITFALDQPYERSTMHMRRDYLQCFSNREYDLYSGFERRKLGYCNLIRAADAKREGLSDLLDQIEQTAFAASPARDLLVLALMLQVVIKINHLVVQAEDVSYDAAHNEKVSEMIEFINDNLEKDLSLDALEKRFFLSKYHLSHIFREATGFPINRYITNKRIKRADELIAGGMSTIDACMNSGFNDYSNFYRSFKKLLGRSPKQSRSKKLS